ncbi:hypothetical protein AAFF_G00053480 [Aldrovandia affinis]|uniref:Uncharacterized protein n=1 Tax=Aldrovandia affinis TaxID=143900 RepID=A0AAD7WFG2_9TELE|nr:hypothetical protein AAFF_G00053480 [Aldrovandia affinis]
MRSLGPARRCAGGRSGFAREFIYCSSEREREREHEARRWPLSGPPTGPLGTRMSRWLSGEARGGGEVDVWSVRPEERSPVQRTTGRPGPAKHTHRRVSSEEAGEQPGGKS